MSRRRSVPALLTALILSLLAIAFPGAASAGGPTSVLLVVPGNGRTASLYTGSPDYEELSRLVGMGNGPSGEKTAPPGMGDAAGVTITWLIHDAQVWRVDRVDLSAAQPVITTQEDWNDGSIWDAPARTHGSTDGKALVTLLNRLGVGADANAQPVAAQPVSAPDGSASAPAAPIVSDGAEGWVWGLAGMLFGAVLTGLGLVLGRRVIARPANAGPADAGPAGDVESLAADPDLELLDSHPGTASP